jgi:glycyl-tRNA synthetase
MSEPSPATSAASTSTAKSMDEIVALCRRRGFIFQSSEIYGGINGFWDYGPLGTELKRNLKNAWWQDIVQSELIGFDGKPIDMVGLDTTIITHPKVWEASGHVAGFNDPMVDDKETKQRFRADHLQGIYRRNKPAFVQTAGEFKMIDSFAYYHGRDSIPNRTIVASNPDEAASLLLADAKIRKLNGIKSLTLDQFKGGFTYHIPGKADFGEGLEDIAIASASLAVQAHPDKTPSPFTGKMGALTEPRQFNLMFETYVGAVRDEESKTYLRPETAQGIFVNFWNVVDTSRVKVPFGIAQQGKAFRNEVTPRNFTFRSREFEQMEIEFFIHPSTANEWYKFWRDQRYQWWQSIGLTSSNLQLREHEKDELAHYAKEGAGTSDIEYRFPFTAPGFGELEGVAHRADFDLKAHAAMTGKGDKLKYFDQDLQVKLQNEGKSKEEINERSRYFPHVIEPSAGADRGALALLCEAFTPTPERQGSAFVMKFHPRMAPIKAAVFPLVNKDGMPEVAEKLYRELRQHWRVDFDEKQSIGKRYARMDEAGTPFCFTIDGDTLKDQTVTVRHRDTAQQERIGIDRVGKFLMEKIGA